MPHVGVIYLFVTKAVCIHYLTLLEPYRFSVERMGSFSHKKSHGGGWGLVVLWGYPTPHIHKIPWDSHVKYGNSNVFIGIPSRCAVVMLFWIFGNFELMPSSLTLPSHSVSFQLISPVGQWGQSGVSSILGVRRYHTWLKTGSLHENWTGLFTNT